MRLRTAFPPCAVSTGIYPPRLHLRRSPTPGPRSRRGAAPFTPFQQRPGHEKTEINTKAGRPQLHGAQAPGSVRAFLKKAGLSAALCLSSWSSPGRGWPLVALRGFFMVALAGLTRLKGASAPPSRPGILIITSFSCMLNSLRTALPPGQSRRKAEWEGGAAPRRSAFEPRRSHVRLR